MIQPIKSIKARYIYPSLQRHFEKTRYGKKIASYKGKYEGKRCFIVANGPSLRVEDLTLLYERKEITFAMNRIYNVFEETPWRPTYYVSQDPLIIEGKQKEISGINTEEKFIPIELKWDYNISIDNACYFHIDYADKDLYPYTFSYDCAHQIDGRSTVTFTCMELAVYMGFSKIYLLGVDHNFRVTIDIDGNVITDPTQKDYFVEGYDADIKDSVVHDVGKNTRAFLDARKYCDTLNGKSVIYNATRGGKLEVFERVDFDTLF